MSLPATDTHSLPPLPPFLFIIFYRYQEVLEKELMCVSLRGSCLTPEFHLRELQGRGLVSCIDTTAGQLVRLVQRK
jgi:hypothetical protein